MLLSLLTLLTGMPSAAVALEPPKAELVLRESYMISKEGVSSILPLGKQYLCVSTFAGEIKIFDRLKKQVVLSEDSLSLQKIRYPHLRSLIHHKSHLYAEVFGTLYTYPFDWKDKSKLPAIGAAKLVNLKGEKAKKLWSINNAAICLTESNKLYWLEDGNILWDKSIDILKMTQTEASEAVAVFLNTYGLQTRLVVHNKTKLCVFDFPAMKLERELSLPGLSSYAICAKDKLYILYIMELGVMDVDGKIKYHTTYDYRNMIYIESKDVLLLWGSPESIAIASADGIMGKTYVIPTGVFESPYVEGNIVYFGFAADTKQDKYVGGGYLRMYEVK